MTFGVLPLTDVYLDSKLLYNVFAVTAHQIPPSCTHAHTQLPENPTHAVLTVHALWVGITPYIGDHYPGLMGAGRDEFEILSYSEHLDIIKAMFPIFPP